MAQSQHTAEDTADRRSLASRVLGVASRRKTYTNLAYLLARFPLGITYFTVFVTGLSLGFGLIPVVVGVPILAGVLGLAGYVGVVEAGLLSRLYGQDVSHDVADPGDLSVVDYLKTVATAPQNYLLVLFALGSFVVGLQLFVAITVVFTLALTLVAAPLVYWMPGVKYDLTQATGTVDIGPVVVDAASVTGVSVNTLPEALVASALGVVVCLVGLHAVNLAAWALRTLTERLLGATPE
jgi:hypothetical protein